MTMTKEEFNEAGNLIGFWIYTATNLLNSSNFLKVNDSSFLFTQGHECLGEKEETFRNFLSVSHMLRGMAFECFLKAVLIKKSKIKIIDGEIEKNHHNQHDLVKMAEAADIKLNILEKESLKILTADIILGRYPIFKKHTNYTTLQKGRYWNDKLERESKKLLIRVKAELK